MPTDLDQPSDEQTVDALFRIWRQALADGGLLPPEKELSTLLGVGRNSVREALIRLEAEGFVARRHGAGTFANPAALEVPVRIDRTAEYADILRDAGCTPEIEVLESRWTALDDHSAASLRADVGQLAYRTVKRWLADGVPMMVAVDLIPASRRVDVKPSNSVFEIAVALTGRTTYWVSSYVTPVLAGERANLLGCAKEDPVLHLEQVGVSRNGDRCWWSSEHHHAHHLRYGLVRTLDAEPSSSRYQGSGEALPA